ncbi:MAG TPA: site-specific DNA-methyltransferase [Nocardioidaceae bacterium]|nr:site-specific DNA-methyltransferase [Nocardioidaceae bacterium]
MPDSAGDPVTEPLVDLSTSGDVVVQGDNAAVLPRLPSASFQVVYIDPPFNTGARRDRRTLRTSRAGDADRGDRTGFGGRRYSTVETTRMSYPDSFEDYAGFLAARLEEARRLLTESGTLFVHLDWREAHYCKVLLDDVFGRGNFLNEVIWAYDYGGRAKDRWPAKHDTILVYVKQVGAHLFDQGQIDRVPYLAPGLVGPAKAARGKLPTDVWWHTIVSPTGREKTGYPTQKPEGVLRRVLAPSSRPGDWVLDFFAGSGTTGAAATALGRRFVLVDANPEAVAVMRGRLPGATYLDQDGRPLPTPDLQTPTPPPR